MIKLFLSYLLANTVGCLSGIQKLNPLEERHMYKVTSRSLRERGLVESFQCVPVKDTWPL